VQPLPGADDDADTLAELVDRMPADGELSGDMECLADAIYFEARGEELAGQLAVGRVIVNRAQSGRFPTNYCGVVYQRGQFSFVRGGHMPRINTSSAAWRRAKAIAAIAHEGLWDSAAKGALFFHAAYVRPGWGLTRVARIDHHVFYR
jgi:spore germination cell wall hydrolase CwlJ-like protein